MDALGSDAAAEMAKQLEAAGPFSMDTWQQSFIGVLSGSHANAVAVLGSAWNSENNRTQLRQLIMNAMAAYYSQNPDDQSRLTKILEIAHELKPNGLAELFNLQQFPFVIDLACLASRREFLKLEKFVEDKLVEHGDAFARHLCNFLRRRCPGITANPIASESFQTVFSSLQSRASFSPFIASELNQIVSQLRNSQQMKAGGDAGRMSSGVRTPVNVGPPGLAGTPTSGSSAFPYSAAFSMQSSGLGGDGHVRTPVNTPPQGMGPMGSAFPPFQQQQQSRDQAFMRALRPSSVANTPMDFRSSSTQPMGGAATAMGILSGAPGQQRAENDDLPDVAFSEDVQEQANAYFQQIYSRSNRMDVKVFIDKLKAFRASPVAKERELLQCIVENLFKKYLKFKDYSEIELRTTAEVYGGIIRENIVSNIQFATAVRRVIESLHSPAASPMRNFGVWALSACRSALFRYPKVCQIIASLESFSQLPTVVRDYVNNGIQGQIPASLDRNTPSWTPSQGVIAPPAVQSSSAMVNVSNMKFAPKGLAGTSILNMTSVDTLVNATEREGTQLTQPAQPVYEKVSFICNNLSQANIQKKTDEIAELIEEQGEEFVRWLAQYLVMKRVTVENNFQPLYNNFLIAIGDVKLNEFVKKETYRNIAILLRSDKRQAASNFSDRQLIKNLGHWLGLITIGRDQPILLRELDLKGLLLDAFYKGQEELLYVVPFVVKVLDASSKSTLFGPRCAWIYGIVKVLVEIHNEPDLKLNLKFEIEVLCRDLHIDLRSVDVGSYLKENSRLPKLLPVKPEGISPVPQMPGRVAVGGGMAFEMAALRAALPAAAGVATSKADGSSLQRPSTVPPTQAQPTATYHYNDINIYSPDGLTQCLKDPSDLPLFQLYPHLKMLCRTAIVHAIKELIGGISDRAIDAAITATGHICRKDFASDPNEHHLLRAADQMMRAMTAGMAAISIREPLATTIQSCLRQLLYNHMGVTPAQTEQAKMIDDAAMSVTSANLEFATNFIVKSACEKAVAEVEKYFESEIQARKSARREGRPFASSAEWLSKVEKLPEMIRPKIGEIGDHRLGIYDDFSSKICGFKPLSVEDIFAEFTKRGSVTPAGSSKTPSNFASFVPAAPSDAARPGSNLLSGAERGQALVGGGEVKTAAEEDHSGLQIKVEAILREWINLCYTPDAQHQPQRVLASIVKMMHANGVLATDEMISKFFKLCADICFDVSYRLLKNDTTSQATVVRQRCYYTLDAFVKLTCLMVKYSDGSHHSTKLNLLKKVLGIITTALHTDHETRKSDFNGMPFHRILIIMFNELTAPDPILDSISLEILESFGHALFVLQPRRVPGFAFHWLDIIGNRNFIGRLLSDSFDAARSGAMYTQLILCHMKFLAPYLRNVQLSKPIAVIYKGTLRILLVILHDFPEILCQYHYVLCDVIPANCVQLRNLVLSAYPRDMRLPDPFTQSMEVIESLPEMNVNPKMHREMADIISPELKTKLDDYLATRSSVNFLSELPGLLQVSQMPGSKYNVSVVNTVVMYVGVKAIDYIHEKSQRITTATIAHTAFMDIFQNLAVSLCTEGRYLLFNAIANQLRYPNSHTQFFSCTLLYIFLEANTEIIQEQITRILFERLVALRPHPWGLLITFIELIRTERYNFWKHDFVRCAPEIQRLFTSVANSCSVSQGAEQTNGVHD